MTFQNRYASYKAIESDAKNDDTQWLTYWVVYSVLMIAESFADYSVFWIPGYRFAKCGFIFWLASPRFKGALMLYDKCIRETLKKAEPIIDSVSAQLAKGDLSAVQKELAPDGAPPEVRFGGVRERDDGRRGCRQAGAGRAREGQRQRAQEG